MRYRYILIVLVFLVLPARQTQAHIDANSNANNDTSELKIVVTSLEVGDKALKLSYDIKNNSERDAWFLAERGFISRGLGFGMGVGAFIAEDGETLTLRKRIGTEWDYMTYEPVYARYIRVRPGESQSESFFATMPFHLVYSTDRVSKQEQGLKYATHLVIELGYYTVDLRETTHITNLTNKDEEVSLPCLSMFRVPEFKRASEQFLKTVVDNLCIPYEEKQYSLPYEKSAKPPVKYKPPDLTSCTKIEIRYQPSMLEYFFPYSSHQRLMSPEEIKYLQSETLIVDNPEDIKAIARYFSKAIAVDRGVGRTS